MTNFNLKMIIMILMGLLMGAGYANVGPKQTSKRTSNSGLEILRANYQTTITDKRSNQVVTQNTAIFYDNDTLLAPNSRGEMTLYTIVEPTWEVNIPGVLDKTVNVTGAADKVIEYINVNFPHYRWSNVDDLDPVSPEKTAQDGPEPNCRAFQQAPYATADICRKTLKQIGNHYFKLGAGPGTCAQAECRTDFYGHQAAIWWCNDVSEIPRRLPLSILVWLLFLFEFRN